MNKRYEKECENGTEYIIPDYLGEIKRVLFAEARPVTDGNFDIGDDTDVVGSVGYSLLFVDSEGKLCGTETSSDFEMRFANVAQGAVRSSEVRVTSFTYRATGPRKLQFKSRLKAVLLVDDDTVAEDGIDPDAELLTANTERYRELYGEKREIEYNEKIYESEEGNVEILTSFGNVDIADADTTDGGVAIRGKYIIGAILTKENGDVFTVRREIPFEEVVNIEGATSGMPAQVRAEITSLDLSQSGDGVSAALVADLYAKAGTNESCTVVRDGYYKNCSTMVEYAPVSNISMKNMSQRQIPYTLNISNAELGVNELRDVLRIKADPTGIEVKNVDGAVAVEGTMNVGGIACEINCDAEAVYTPIKVSLPFMISVACEGVTTSDKADVTVSVADIDATIGDDGLSLLLTLDVCCFVYDEHEIQCVKKLEKCGEPIDRDASVYTVYYPEKDETLFDVAKRFSISRERIARDNSLDDSVMAGDGSPLPKRLIIT